jgi:hypothetical protein
VQAQPFHGRNAQLHMAWVTKQPAHIAIP